MCDVPEENFKHNLLHYHTAHKSIAQVNCTSQLLYIQFRILRSLKLGEGGEMVSFGNFARKVSLSVGSDLGTLHRYFFTSSLDQI